MRLLIAEDDRDISKALVMILEKNNKNKKIMNL